MSRENSGRGGFCCFIVSTGANLMSRENSGTDGFCCFIVSFLLEQT